MRKFRLKNASLFVLILLAGLFSTILPVSAQSPVVQAVLFYSPTCPHCERVMQNTINPMLNQYGDQLVVLEVDVTTPDGNALYAEAQAAFTKMQETVGVPTLIVGDTVMVGEVDIPDQFPQLVADGLKSGGINWPDFAGLADYISKNGINAPIGLTSPSISEVFGRDVTGNSISLFVLFGLVATVIGNGIGIARAVPLPRRWPKWIIPALILLGLGVSIYLSYVELTQTSAVCGPVGDCNAVQQSNYARLFGILPIGLLGVIGYSFIGLAWLAKTYGPSHLQRNFTRIMWGLSAFGILFSIYLTFLEPFVIGATCAWCLTSAIVMLFIFWTTSSEYILAFRPVKKQKIKKGSKKKVKRH
jgi:uncharacterized membrane protein/thiol-disulfide isomerase/thioredoxin